MSDPSIFADCWFITGPTASGKTRVGLELAERIDGEIISLDSMAIYQGMDIGTAKPTEEQRQQIQHHLIDIVPPWQEFSISQYLELAASAVEAIASRGKQAIFVGGTPLYLKALLRGLDQGPPADPEFRNELEKELTVAGLPALHQRLRQIDPLAAARIHPHDKRRMIRALEFYRATGQPISHAQRHFDEPASQSSSRAFALTWNRSQLHERINERVQRMFAEGLVEEVKRLAQNPRNISKTAMQAVGYREVFAYIDGDHDLEATVKQVQTRTRRFARRQETWFRSLSELSRVTCSEERSPRELAELICEAAE